MKNISKGKTDTNKKISIGNITSWIFGIIFIVIGILNAIFVHRVPGILYPLFSLMYFPQTNKFLKRKFGFTIPLIVKIILGLVILWGTLAVGDLMEMFEAYLRK